MLKNLINKEIREIIRSTKFSFSFAVCSILILLTFYVGAKNYHVNRGQYEAAVAENIRSMESLTDWRQINYRISLPPLPLAYLVSGISNDIGRNIEVTGRGELTPEDSKYNEDPIFAAFRFLDLTFLFQVILSLFAVLLTYNAVNGEKELGTLRLVFSNPVPRDKYIMAKILGTFSAISFPLLIPFLIGSMLLILFGVPMNGQDWLKLMLIIVSGFLFFGTFLTLSVFVSTITKHSANSFLFLLVAWVIAVLIIPRASVMLAGNMVDVPSVDDINSQKSVYSRQVSTEMLNSLKQFKAKNLENVMQEFSQYMETLNVDRDEKMNTLISKLNEERRNKQEVQQNLSFAISRVSPATSFSFAASSLAGTSVDLMKNYKEQASNYQKVFANFQIEKTGGTTDRGLRMVQRGGEDVETIDPAELPKFEFQNASFVESLSSSIIDIGLLFLFNIIFFAGSFVSFLRFDLR